MPFVSPTSEFSPTVVGDGECVTLVKQAAGIGKRTGEWRAGIPVKGNGAYITPGTAIATFVNGQYPQENIKGSHHAAIYIGQDATCIWVSEQYHGQSVQKTHLKFGGNSKKYRRSGDANLYFVVE